MMCQILDFKYYYSNYK